MYYWIWGSESGFHVAEVSSICKTFQLQRSRHSFGRGPGEIIYALEQSEGCDGLIYEKILMLEATLLLGGM
jgi:hypothetical protein